MRRFFVFTLSLLFSTVCLFLTTVEALDSNYKFATKFNGTVYGESNVWTWFDATSETAHSDYAVYVWNDGPGSVKYYATYTVKVVWNGGSVTPKPREKSGLVHANNSGADNDDGRSYLLRNKNPGRGRISATTLLEVRHIPTNVKRAWPLASTATAFTLQ